MDKYDGLTDAVIDVTRPAFEGIEDCLMALEADIKNLKEMLGE